MKYNKKVCYYPEINIKTANISKYGINDINNFKEVKEKISNYYKYKYISNTDILKPIENIHMHMKIEIWKSGINETFGNAYYYKNLSDNAKRIKLATMDSLAKMIKYGKIRAKRAINYHNCHSPAQYYYLKHPIIVDNRKFIVNIDIKKVPGLNGRFYIHSIDKKN